jgi:hypothetical protein
MPGIANLIGGKYGRLTVVGPGYRRKNKTIWRCLCECGKTIDVEANNLKIGNTKSCGCFRREFTTAKNTTHGMASRDHELRPAEYTVWCRMRDRCTSPSNPSWADYGGRGITVDPTWLESFETFYADMGPRPTPDHQLDRVNNMSGYGPGNCRWATRIENCSNRRDNIFVEWRGETQTVSEWARRVGMHNATLSARLFLLHWDVEAAMTTPVRQSRRKPKAA